MILTCITTTVHILYLQETPAAETGDPTPVTEQTADPPADQTQEGEEKPAETTDTTTDEPTETGETAGETTETTTEEQTGEAPTEQTQGKLLLEVTKSYCQ